MSAFSGGLHYQLEQIFARSFNPLLDLLCELFLSPEELRRQRDRSQRLKTLTRQLQRYTTPDPMPMVLSRLLVSNLLFVRQQANLLRHFVPGSKIEPVKPQVTERLFEANELPAQNL